MNGASELAAAREVGAFLEYLEQARYGGQGSSPYTDSTVALAAAFADFVDALEEGREPLPAMTRAVCTWHEIRDQQQADRNAAYTREQKRLAQHQADEEISRKVECPYCGSAPGESCRTVSQRRYVCTDSHRGRWRLARGLSSRAAG